MSDVRIIAAQVDLKTAEQIELLAKREDRSASSVIRRLIREGLDQERRAHSRADKAMSQRKPFSPENIWPVDTYLTTADVARRLGVVPGRVRQLRKSGELIPLHVTWGGVAWYDRSCIEEFAIAREEARGASPVTNAPSSAGK